ncbi:MAG: hypothetical protein ACYSSP_04080 [Planctomycetota bacterium]|jgi:hypothetical protein
MESESDRGNQFCAREEGVIDCTETLRNFILFLLLLVFAFGFIFKRLIIAGPGGGIGLFFSPAVILGLVSLLGLSLPIFNHQPLLLHIVLTFFLSALWLRMGELIAVLLFKDSRLTLCVCEVCILKLAVPDMRIITFSITLS